MAFTIEEHHVLKYADDVQNEYQQFGSRLRECVEVKTGIVGKSFSVNTIGLIEAATKDSRHEQHSHQNPEHTARWGNLVYYYNSVMMDPDDDDRVLADPRNKYVQAGASSLGRRTDRTILAALVGTAITGEDRTGTQALPTAQLVTGSTSGFTAAKFKAAVMKMNEDEVPDQGRYLALSAQGIDDLLAETAITSVDFNDNKPLVNGKVMSWMGVQIIMTQLLPITAGLVRQAVMWQKSAVVLGISRDNYSRIALRRDMHDAWETYTAKDIGAVRQFDKGVVAINYLET